MALDNNIDELQIEITTESNDAAKGIDALRSSLSRLEQIASGGAGLRNVASQVTTLDRAVSRAFSSIAASISRVADICGDWFAESADYVEALNLFDVSMGDASSAALEYAETVQDLMGIDVQDWVEAQGSFNQLLEGYGIADAKAAQMSKQLTQLGYDLSSLWNVDVDTAMKRLQSGMSGQIKGLKTWGVNLSVAQLRETALAHGIELSTAKMTEGQKAMLRYITLMEKTTNVQGDLARTLITPSNAMRIFEQQVTQLRRALGDIVSVVVARFIPVFQMIVQAAAKAAQALAKFFGYELPEIDYSGIETGASAADDMADGLSSAASSAKKLKQYTMGFDELNVIDPNKGSFGGSTPTGGGLSNDFGFDPSKYEYDFLKGVNKDADELSKKMKTVLDVVVAIAGAITGWKIAAGVMGFFEMLAKLVESGVISSVAAGLKILVGAALAGAGAFLEIKNALDAWNNGLTSSNMNGMLLGMTGLVAGLGLAFGPVGAAIGAVTGAVVIFGTSLKDLFENGLNENNITGITVMTATVIALGAAFGPVGVAVGVAAAAITTLVVAVNHLSGDCVDAVEIFDDTISDTTRNKVEPFIDQCNDMSLALKSVAYSGEFINPEQVANAKAKVKTVVDTICSELDSDRNQALATLEPLRAALGEKAYSQLLADNSKYYDTVIANVQAGENRINEIMASAQAQNRAITEDEWTEITNIQAQMQDTGIQHLSETEVEYQTIMNRLKDNATRISLEQASEIIKNAKDTKEQTIENAQTQYATIELEAQRMLEVGAINQEQYDSIMQAAATTKDQTIADANEQYQTIYDTTMTKLGETASFIDAETGEIKSKWQNFCDNTAAYWSNKWTEIKNGFVTWKDNFKKDFDEFKETFKKNWAETWDRVTEKWGDWKDNFSKGWDDFKSNFSKGWRNFWKGIANFFINAWNGILVGLENAINFCIDGLNALIDKVNELSGLLGITFSHISRVTIERVPLMEIEEYASGGFPDQGQFFLAREDGAEMVGQIGSRTAVANNDQIVSGITNGVKEGNGDLISAIFTVASQLVQAMEDNRTDVIIGDDDIGRANDRYEQSRGVRVNSGSFANAY